MNTLRYADELRSLPDLSIPASALHGKATAKELDMALRLIDDMSEKWQPQKFKDTYRDDLMARIEEKVKAGQTEQITQPEKGRKEAAGAEVIDLMALLRKSVERKQEKAEKPKRHARSKRRAA